jgi:hypothetical protein
MHTESKKITFVKPLSFLYHLAAAPRQGLHTLNYPPLAQFRRVYGPRLCKKDL